ncbi:hypothetical protein SCACP_35900 [Sporomusa carbonis]
MPYRIIKIAVSLVFSKKLNTFLTILNTIGVNNTLSLAAMSIRLQRQLPRFILGFGIRLLMNPCCRFVFWCATGRRFHPPVWLAEH